MRLQSRKKKKGQREITVRLTAREMTIIEQEMAKSNSEFVFTYEIQRGLAKGSRSAITRDGFRRVHNNALRQAEIVDFRPHDFRHTFATRLLRQTSNLKITQQALDHSDITSTVKYAHVLDEDVMEARAQLTVFRNSPGVADLARKAAGKKVIT